jgi:hypothetical protein
MVKGYSGMKADITDDTINSYQAKGAIPMGRGVFKCYGIPNACRLPAENVTTITDSAGTFTAGSIATTINGTVITTNWATDKATTMAAHAAAIQAGVANVYSAVYTDGSHTIAIKTRNTGLIVTVSVAGVTGTMTISSIVNTNDDAAAGFLGVAIHDHAREQTSAGVVQYNDTEIVSVMAEGAVYVYVEEAVTTDDDVYVRIFANGTKLPGMFGTSSDSSKCILLSGVKFMDNSDANSIVKLTLNLPQ